MALIITVETKVTELVNLPGIRLDGESMSEYGNFARAYKAEILGDHADAEKFLTAAIAGQEKRLAK